MKVGTQIVYVPAHADGPDHPDCEQGFIVGCSDSHDFYFCRYFNNIDGALRTTAYSVSTPAMFVRKHNHRSEVEIKALCRELGYEYGKPLREEQ